MSWVRMLWRFRLTKAPLLIPLSLSELFSLKPAKPGLSRKDGSDSPLRCEKSAGKDFLKLSLTITIKSFRTRFEFWIMREIISQFVDPYIFPPILTDFDLHLMGEGTHFKKYEKLGGHLRTIQGVSGVHFAAWAPNAARVSVIGDFNRWDGRRHPMRVRGSTGIWEIFIPGLGEGCVYKFEIKSRYNNYLAIKSDPYGTYFERPSENCLHRP